MIEEKNTKINNAKYIKNFIYEIRGERVIFDSDLAILYNCSNGTKQINLAVRRNIERFPKRFCFQLTDKEYESIINENLRFQNETSSLRRNNYGGRRYLPYAFTEQGVAMLASVLKTDISANISVQIMDAFVYMRRIITNNSNLVNRLIEHDIKLLEHDKKFDEVFKQINKETNIKQKVFFSGQIYDAYSLLVDIILSAEKKIIIIDNYVDKTIMDLLTKKKCAVNVTIITGNHNLSKLDISKFNEQYPKLNVSISTKYHDRFIIIDDIVYHCGASLKDLGKKCFAINKIEDISSIKQLLGTKEHDYMD